VSHQKRGVLPEFGTESQTHKKRPVAFPADRRKKAMISYAPFGREEQLVKHLRHAGCLSMKIKGIGPSSNNYFLGCYKKTHPNRKGEMFLQIIVVIKAM
jgi:hypothetical protein